MRARAHRYCGDLLLERRSDGGRDERGGIKSGSWGLPSPRYYFNYFFLAAFFFAAFFLAFFFAAIIVSFKVNLGIAKVRR